MKKLVASVVMVMLANPVFADDSVDHSAQASKHSVLASVEGVSVGASVASAVVAVPVIVTAAAVVTVASAADSMADSVHQSHQSSEKKPLVITTKVFTRDPPPSEVVVEQTVVNH